MHSCILLFLYRKILDLQKKTLVLGVALAAADLIDDLVYQKTEPWEHEKELVDREKYIWEGSPSQAAAQTVVTARGTSDAEELLKEYRQVVTDLHNEGEFCFFLSK